MTNFCDRLTELAYIKLCYKRSVCTYISIPTIYMYKVESIECIVWLSYQSHTTLELLFYISVLTCAWMVTIKEISSLGKRKYILLPSLYIHSRPVMCIHYSLLSVMAEKNDGFIHFFLHRVSIVCKYVLSFDTWERELFQ